MLRSGVLDGANLAAGRAAARWTWRRCPTGGTGPGVRLRAAAAGGGSAAAIAEGGPGQAGRSRATCPASTSRSSSSRCRPSTPAGARSWNWRARSAPTASSTDPRQARRCAINLSHVTLSVPFDESEFYGEEVRARRMVRLQEVTGRIVFEPAEVRVDIRGLLNGEPMRVWGRMTGYNGPLKAMGYDLQIDVRRMAHPGLPRPVRGPPDRPARAAGPEDPPRFRADGGLGELRGPDQPPQAARTTRRSSAGC